MKQYIAQKVKKKKIFRLLGNLFFFMSYPYYFSPRVYGRFEIRRR